MQHLLEELDPKSVDMLRAIDDRGGEATTPEIREVTGLSNSQVAYRREKLREFGLIDVRTGEPTGSRTPPKSHSLTPSARSHVEAGLFELADVPVTSDVTQLSTQINHLRGRVDQLAETVDRLEEGLAALNHELDARVGADDEVRETADGSTMASAVQVLQADVADLRKEVSELDERKRDRLFG